LGPQFVGGRDTPDFGHAFSNRSHFWPCGQFWLSSVQRAPIVEGQEGEKEYGKNRYKKVCRHVCQAA